MKISTPIKWIKEKVSTINEDKIQDSLDNAVTKIKTSSQLALDKIKSIYN